MFVPFFKVCYTPCIIFMQVVCCVKRYISIFLAKYFFVLLAPGVMLGAYYEPNIELPVLPANCQYVSFGPQAVKKMEGQWSGEFDFKKFVEVSSKELAMELEKGTEIKLKVHYSFHKGQVSNSTQKDAVATVVFRKVEGNDVTFVRLFIMSYSGGDKEWYITSTDYAVNQ